MQGGALRSTLLQWCPEPHHYSPNPPSFPLSQPSCSSTWVQNHEFSKSLKTTQRVNQGTRGFQRRAALPCISKSCPIADLTYTHTRAHTHTQEPELLSRRSLLSPSLPTQLLLLWAGEDSIPRVSHLPSPDPSPLPEPAHAPFPSSLLPSHPQAQSRTSGSSCGWSIQGQAWGVLIKLNNTSVGAQCSWGKGGQEAEGSGRERSSSREARRQEEPRKEQGSAWHLMSVQWVLVNGRLTLETRRVEKPGGDRGTKSRDPEGGRRGAGGVGAHGATERPLRREGK